MTAAEASKALASREVSSRELTQATLERIAAVDSKVKSFLKIIEDQALSQADRFDANPQSFPGGLAGVPGALKDNICMRGIETTCGSLILEGWQPPYDAGVVTQIQDSGSVVIGKTNLDEFAMGSSTENSAYFTTCNPWNTRHVPGGSSGGSAAAVAAGEVFWALGSDTGGSIRQPAAYCGVVGLKPTYGRVSRYGVIAYASSLDQIGPLTRTVEDAALVMNMISAHDPKDSTSYPEAPPDYTKSLKRDVSGFTIGIPREFFGQGIADPVAQAVMDSATVLERSGARLIDVSTPNVGYGLPCYYILAPAEASSNLARYDGVRYGMRVEAGDHAEMFRQTRERGFGAEVKQRIVIGTYVLSAGYYDAFYLKAQQVRTLLSRDFEQVFSQCDLLITPTVPTTAFAIGEHIDDPFQMKLSDVCTSPVNLAGLPAMSVPCGFSDGLPIGMQLIAPAFAEERIFQAAYTFEQATDYHKARPSI
ncbi:MAG: Asp-tRNA(Asn)/Glu-tRNA(Gln) amidotransferase subunit GatA [Armatimonadetes bacterium]|nr:Asp-tRNA(Asn)/Glu-tRNA(Gln) amidotransferase subunit GatA [Armatimonadota bacterium]